MSRVDVSQPANLNDDPLSRCREDLERLDAVLEALKSERTRLARVFERIIDETGGSPPCMLEDSCAD
jgi:hypothetical protein